MNKHITQSQLESYLWGAAVLLRGYIDAGDYKQFIFPLLFYKRLCDVYDEEVALALEESGGDKQYALFPENHRFQIRVKLGRRVTGIVGKLLDQVLVADSKFILGTVRHRQCELAEMLDQLLERVIRQPILVGPLGIPENAKQLLRVCRLDDPHRILKRLADVFADLPSLRPMCILGNRTAMTWRNAPPRWRCW